MTSRETILDRLRKNKPEISLEATSYKPPEQQHDLTQQFIKQVESIGGHAESVESRSVIRDLTIKMFPSEQPILFAAEGLAAQSEGETSKAHPKVAVLEGLLGVAENGAVWITDEMIPNTLLPFICEHLVLVLPAQGLCATMHEAYAHIKGTDYRFGTFIAGPSKTADIEQSLVLGAQGPMSLSVFVVAQ